MKSAPPVATVKKQVRPTAGKLGCCTVGRKTSRDLKGAPAARFVSWGAHQVHNPVCRCAVCSSLTPIDYHGRQVYQKNTHQCLLLWEVSVMQKRLGLSEPVVVTIKKGQQITLLAFYFVGSTLPV